MFVETAFPRVIRGGKIHRPASFPGYPLVVRKLLAVVERDRMARSSRPLQHFNHRVSNIRRMAVVKAAHQDLFGVAVNQGHNHALMAAADDRVTLPVADPGLLLDNLRTLLDVLPVGNDTATRYLSLANHPLLALVAKTLEQIAAGFGIGPNIVVYPTGTSRDSLFQLQSTRNLLRTPAKLDQILNLLPQLRRNLSGNRRGLAPPLRGLPVGLKGIVATRNRIPINFTVDRSIVAVENFGNVMMRIAT